MQNSKSLICIVQIGQSHYELVNQFTLSRIIYDWPIQTMLEKDFSNLKLTCKYCAEVAPRPCRRLRCTPWRHPWVFCPSTCLWPSTRVSAGYYCPSPASDSRGSSLGSFRWHLSWGSRRSRPNLSRTLSVTLDDYYFAMNYTFLPLLSVVRPATLGLW